MFTRSDFSIWGILKKCVGLVSAAADCAQRLALCLLVTSVKWAVFVGLLTRTG